MRRAPAPCAALAGLPGPYLVLGCARAGSGAALALATGSGGAAVRVWDEDDGPETRERRARLAARGIAVRLGPWDPALLDGVGAVVKSPGIAAVHPAVAGALQRGLPVVDELELGHRLADRPLLAVTGTDGKSTVCALLAEALGRPGTPAVIAGNTAFGPPLTQIPPEAGAVVVEASSYQLEHCAGPFSALAVLTNLSGDHVPRHGSLAGYAAAKRRLFLHDGRAVGLAVLPAGSTYARSLATELRAAGSTVATFGPEPEADFRIVSAAWDARRADVRLTTPDGPLTLRTRLPGPHNAENVAAALAACALYGIDPGRAVAAVERCGGVPGRWEHVDAGQDFSVVVDFAHTPAGLAHALRTARAVVEPQAGRVLLVLSSGGGNDSGYRPLLGETASRLADRALVTEGNGRGEPRDEVIAAIRAGAVAGGAVLEPVPDRRAAIAAAISGAAPGDLVLIVDRGAMPRLLTDRAGGGPAFDDRAVAREELLRHVIQSAPTPRERIG